MFKMHTFIVVVLLAGFLLSLTISQDNPPIQEGSLSYAINPVSIKQLVIVEETLVRKLISYSNNTLDCKKILNQYFERYNQENNVVKGVCGAKRAEAVVTNGLLAFKLIYRLVKFFENWNKLSQCTLNDQSNKTIWTIINQEFAQTNMSIPSKFDLKDAMKGLLRIHYIYAYNASTQLRIGKFDGIDTNVELDFEECMDLAAEALALKTYVLCYQWLIAATEIAITLNHGNILKTAWTNFSSQTNTSIENLRTILPGQIQRGFPEMEHYQDYHSCRLDLVNREQVENLKVGQHCYYHRSGDPYLMLNPVKAEVLTEEPVLIQYHDFIGEEAIAFIKNSTTNEQFRSIVQPSKPDEPDYGDFITSVEYELLEDVYNGTEIPIVFKRIVQKAKMVTRLNVHHFKGQLIEYGALGGHYDIHHDTLENALAFTPEEGGDRVGHFLFYLSNVALGGYTAFPLLGVRAKPRKGSVLLWYNLLRNGNPDYRMYHCSCPVVLGTKLALRMDVYQHDNVWSYPCDRDPEK